jgi:hypothetical protein
MALPPADPARHRRQQRRRALIGWLGGGAIVALLVLAAILGGGREAREVEAPIPAHSAGLFDYHLTSGQFEALQLGESQRQVLDALGKIGLPESETKIVFIRLFPPHSEAVVCSYWQISDAADTVARLCFARRDGVLREKLERGLSGALDGEQSFPA